MQEYRCFFWDFDGTLYDTYEGIVRAVRKGMDEMGLAHSDADILPLLKTTLRQACLALAGQDRADELLSHYFMHAQDEGPESMKPFPGCAETLRGVVEAGGVNFLYTHRNNTALEALKNDGLIELFRDFITYEAGFPDKPAPDALSWIIDLHRLDRRECVMIGDRIIDAQAGRNAGIAGALYDPDGFFRPEDADFVFKRLEDIPEKLMQGC